MRATFLAAALTIGCLVGHQGLASEINLKPLNVVGNFEGRKGDVAVDISGIACLAPETGKRTCLLVNDENRNAQLATLESDQITVGQTVALIGKDPDPSTLGTAPEVKCDGGSDGFKDLDGEGVAYADAFFYVIGSHGCSRKSDEFRLSSFILAQVSSDPPHRVRTTYRISDLLNKSDKVKPFFGASLQSGNGLNIEGVAAIGDTLWVGLRAPVSGEAYLVHGSISELFHPGHDQAVTTVHTIGLKLEGRGIRDLAPLPDGRILVLAGPAQDQDVSYKLYIANPATKAEASIGTLETVSQGGKAGKAEGLTVLDVAGNKAEVLVVFDGLKNGAPHSGEIELPQ
jgi:hypothetical protein